MQPSHVNPARLPLGTLVGPWRVLERLGLGAHGAVYRALDARSPSMPVALKVALRPRDARFARERELLSRIHHPHVPRLLDHGEWHLASLSYLAMEWVDGMSLYEWALLRRPSSRQVLRVLASLARALAATHAAGGVHRDFKGDNVLVREGDDWPFLLDFGSGHFIGAATLTEPPFPPGTPPYRSPEAWRSVRLPLRQPVLPYAPTASDDVFALGVTAYRLLTDEYPSPPEPALHSSPQDEGAPPSPSTRNARCLEELSDLTARMLSPNPETRGTARELAQAMEQAAREAGPEADVPLFAPEAAVPASVRPVRTRAVPRHGFTRAVRSQLAAASLGAALALGTAWMLRPHPGVESEQERASRTEEAKDGGTVAVGDTALTAPLPPTQPSFAGSAISVDLPPSPFPGQRRPDTNGRCPSKKHFAINGGCWNKLPLNLKECEADGYYIYKGGCYVPVMPPPRPPTSSPPNRTDDTPD